MNYPVDTPDAYIEALLGNWNLIMVAHPGNFDRRILRWENSIERAEACLNFFRQGYDKDRRPPLFDELAAVVDSYNRARLNDALSEPRDCDELSRALNAAARAYHKHRPQTA